MGSAIWGAGGHPQYKPLSVWIASGSDGGMLSRVSRDQNCEPSVWWSRVLNTIRFFGRVASLHVGVGVRPASGERRAAHAGWAGTGADLGTRAAGEARLDLSQGHFRTHPGKMIPERDINLLSLLYGYCDNNCSAPGTSQSGVGGICVLAWHLVECTDGGGPSGLHGRKDRAFDAPVCRSCCSFACWRAAAAVEVSQDGRCEGGVVDAILQARISARLRGTFESKTQLPLRQSEAMAEMPWTEAKVVNQVGDLKVSHHRQTS